MIKTFVLGHSVIVSTVQITKASLQFYQKKVIVNRKTNFVVTCPCFQTPSYQQPFILLIQYLFELLFVICAIQKTEQLLFSHFKNCCQICNFCDIRELVNFFAFILLCSNYLFRKMVKKKSLIYLLDLQNININCVVCLLGNCQGQYF